MGGRSTYQIWDSLLSELEQAVLEEFSRRGAGTAEFEEHKGEVFSANSAPLREKLEAALKAVPDVEPATHDRLPKRSATKLPRTQP